MLSSITPLGERAKDNSWAVTTVAYVVGSTVGGILLGIVLSPLTHLAADLSTSTSLVVLGVALLASAALDAAGVRPPTLRRQVDENWLTAYRGWVYGAGFGVQLGFGLVTIITSWSMWATVAAAVLMGGSGTTPLLAAPAVGGVFGLTRGLVLLTVRRADSPQRLAALHRRIASGATVTATITKISLALLGLLALGAATLIGASA